MDLINSPENLLSHSHSVLIPLLTLLASLLGSHHCINMCGGIASQFMDNQKQIIRYHVGRLFSYLILGCVAGFLGQSIIHNAWSGTVSIIASIIVGMSLMFFGYKIWLGQSLQFNQKSSLITALSKPLFRLIGTQNSQSGLSVGLLTGLLPCGWLYGFVILAVSTQSAFMGALTLLAFWGGTALYLVFGIKLLKHLLQRLGKNSQRILATIVILIGINSIAGRLLHNHNFDPSKSDTHHCH